MKKKKILRTPLLLKSNLSAIMQVEANKAHYKCNQGQYKSIMDYLKNTLKALCLNYGEIKIKRLSCFDGRLIICSQNVYR